MLLQDFFRLFKRGPDRSRDQRFGGHHFLNRHGIIPYKAKVTVGDNANQFPVFIHNRHTGNPVFGHQFFRVVDFVLGCQIKRIGDHSAFGTFDAVNFLGLFFHFHVFMDDSDSALPGNGNRQFGFGDSVHSRADQRNIQFDSFRQLGSHIDLARQYL